jgi:hypothetical protein
MPTRTPEEIRASIEQNRQELGESLERLRDEVTQLTDWRARLREHQSQLLVASFAVGFVAGGGIAGLVGLLGGGSGGTDGGGRRHRHQ